MNLLKEINASILSEEALTTISAEELWQQNEGSANTYVTTISYLIRPNKNNFDVFYDEGGRRKKYGMVDAETMQSSFVPIRANQKPDAEGFMIYRDADEFEAFKYDGDPIKVDLGSATENDGQVVKMVKGDYLLRQSDDDNFTYTMEKARFFDNGYSRKS